MDELKVKQGREDYQAGSAGAGQEAFDNVSTERGSPMPLSESQASEKGHWQGTGAGGGGAGGELISDRDAQGFDGSIERERT